MAHSGNNMGAGVACIIFYKEMLMDGKYGAVEMQAIYIYI